MAAQNLILSPAQIEFYRTQGYLLLRADQHNLLKPTELQQWAEEIRNWPREKGKWMPYDEIKPNGERQLMRTENFVDYHPDFHRLLCGGEIEDILAQLTGDEMTLFKDKINYKSPGGNGFAAHLDAPAYDHVAAIEHTTANLAVDAATPANGCIEIVPGSHSHWESIPLVPGGGRIDPAWEDAQQWTPVELAPGDMLVFGSHLAHRSKENRTTRPRGMVYATYAGRKDGAGLREKYYEHRRCEFPPDHERVEGRDYARGWRRYGFAAPFAGNPEGRVVAT